MQNKKQLEQGYDLENIIWSIFRNIADNSVQEIGERKTDERITGAILIHVGWVLPFWINIKKKKSERSSNSQTSLATSN